MMFSRLVKERLPSMTRWKFFETFKGRWNDVWYQKVSPTHLLIFRMGTFLFPIYWLVSRYFDYLAFLPKDYLNHKFEEWGFSMMIWFFPNLLGIHVLYALTLLTPRVRVFGCASPNLGPFRFMRYPFSRWFAECGNDERRRSHSLCALHVVFYNA